MPQVNAPHQSAEACLHESQVGCDHSTERRVLLIAHLPASRHEQSVALAVSGKRVHVNRFGKGGDASLRRTDPVAAHLDRVTALGVCIQCPPTHAVASLQHDYRVASSLELACSHEPCEASADYRDVDYLGTRTRRAHLG